MSASMILVISMTRQMYINPRRTARGILLVKLRESSNCFPILQLQNLNNIVKIIYNFRSELYITI